MGIRNKVTKDGFVSTFVDGNTGFFGLEQEVFAAGSNTASVGLVVLSGSNVTASLPDVSSTAATHGTGADGFVFRFVVASTNTFLLSASNSINGGAWTKSIVAGSQWKVVTAVGVSGLNGGAAGWAVNSGSLV